VSDTVIDVRDVTLRLGGFRLYDGASMSIQRGETCALTGVNGSGKSVLLKLICGFVTPDSGEVWVDPSFLSPRRTFPDRFGITIDGPAYLPGRTGVENLVDLARIRRRIGMPQIRAALERVGLDPDTRQKVRNYSLGMKQKLSLAQALMEDPEVLLLDEPFNALDAESVDRVKAVLREERAKGTTILFTSHSRTDVSDLTDRVHRIVDRRIELVGDPSVSS
jgi:ABC-2 type transport system ATP-binding protein